ncbi:hypothetical protein M0804_006159 [Polistes exclamans]|nr:hypothetical protein M0804_006159 [Polistes exclamans]
MGIIGFDTFINGLLYIFIPAIVFYFWIKHKLSYWKRRGVPSLPINSLLRQLKDVILVRKSGSKALGDLYQEANEKDKFFGIYILHKPFLLIKDNELVKSILIKDFDVFSNRYFSVKSANDPATFNLFSVDNPEWKHLRVKLSPVFTSGKIKKLFYLMHETSEAMTDFLQEKFRQNSNISIDAKDVFMKYTTDVISTVAFGARTNSFKEETSEFYRQSLLPFTTSLRRYLSIYKSFFFPELNKKIEVTMMADAREYFSQLFWEIFNEREKSGMKRGDLIDSLIELKNEEQNDDFKFEGDILLGQSLIFFIAGRESSATTICYALAELARESKLQDRLRMEIRETLKSDGFTYEAVQKMKYLHQVISETLRLHPPAPIIDRVATKDYVIPGTNVIIEEGTPVYAVLTGIHVDPNYFPDPLRFDPDRFSDERKADILPYTYMPFGDGPRVCIAQRVGMLQTAVAIIRVINNYEVSLNLNGNYKHDPTNMFIKPGFKFFINGLLFVLTLVAVFYLWMKYKLSYWKRRGVPSLPTSSVLRQFKEIIRGRKSGSIALGDLYKETNEKDKFFGIYILHKPFLLIKDSELVKTILIKDFDVFCNRSFSLKSSNDLASFNLFSADNPEWKHLRVKLSPVFTSGKIKKLFYLMHETSEAMTDFLQEKSDQNSNITINAKEVFMKYTTDVISTVAFGVRTNSFKEETSEFYRQSRLPFKPTLKSIFIFYAVFFFPDIIKNVEFKLMGEARDYFDQLFWETFNEREKSGMKRGDLIDSLIELKNEEKNDDFKFEGDILLGQSLIFFVAGRESSATTICYALAELARESKLQDRLRTEIRETLKSDGFTYEAVQKMKYLHQVISETLRLHPPGPILDRVATKDYVIPGTNVLIEKGTPVYAVLTGIHVDPNYFPDPLRFDPDRFSDERKADILPYTYMPFGDGPRVCIAQRVGMLQTAVGIIQVINNYEVSLNLTGDYKPDPTNMFLKPSENFILDLKKITVEN